MRPGFLPLLCAAAIAGACSGDPAGPPSDAPIVELAAVAATGDAFVAVGSDIAVEDGAVAPGGTRAIAATSPDGTSWSWIDTGHAGFLLDVAHGDGVLVAVGTRSVPAFAGFILRSTDGGATWGEVASDAAVLWTAVAHGNGRFLAVGGGMVAESLDGETWDVVAETDLLAARVAFVLGAFHIYGEGSVVFTSPDAVEWTTHVVPQVNRIAGLAEVDGGLIASGVFDCCFGEMPERIEYFTIRSDESGAPYAEPTGLRALRYAHAAGAGAIVALSPERLHRSTDGESWSLVYAAEPGAFPLGLAHAHGRFVVVGRRYVLTSDDGLDWERVPVPASVAAR